MKLLTSLSSPRPQILAVATLGAAAMAALAATSAPPASLAAVNLAGHRLGRAASRNAARKATTVTLANAATATAVVQIVEAGNFPSASCRRANAAGLRVYPPNQTTSKVVPFSFQSCSRSGPIYLTVQAVQKT